ncbi:beta-eliminating lyase-related protein [Sphingobacterium daejeonense]|uniref:beta-eliminating lyase-related protein n=1 Tax=Sphingobacterium daejeonense TaxID=371142 RepID=UPI0021D0C42B|nr:beta-eliminating lyase-related protein [Sphingobacterium daejeonense]
MKETGNADSQIFFVSGGTQANLLVISHLLKPYESVIAADTGHIEVHETGAIENSGHKINLIPNREGKINIEGIQAIVDAHYRQSYGKTSYGLHFTMYRIGQHLQQSRTHGNLKLLQIK